MLSVGIVYSIYFVLFPLLCLIGMKKQPIEKKVLLSMEDSLYGKGLATCGVFLAHAYAFLVEEGAAGTTILLPFSLFGGMGVLIFFFIGGYGSFASSRKKKEAYLDRYWRKKLTNIYLPTVLIQMFFFGVKCIVFDDGSIKDWIIDSLFGAWYIDVLMLELAFFWVGIKLFKNKVGKIIVLMLASNTALFVIFSNLGFHERWRNGLLLFTFGIIVAWQEEKIIAILNKKFIYTILVSCFLFVATGYMFTVGRGQVWGDLFKNVSGCCLAILLVCFKWKLKLGNTLMRMVGERSLYVYLIHLGVLKLIQAYSVSADIDAGFAVLILAAATIVLTELFYRLGKR